MSVIIEPEDSSIVPETGQVETKPTEPLPSVQRKEFPRGDEDQRVNHEAIVQMKTINTDYQQPRSKLSLHSGSVVSSSQALFDQWVKSEAEQTKNQIEVEREEKRLEKEQQEITNDRLYEMKEVQEMKKQIMSFYIALTNK